MNFAWKVFVLRHFHFNLNLIVLRVADALRCFAYAIAVVDHINGRNAQPLRLTERFGVSVLCVFAGTRLGSHFIFGNILRVVRAPTNLCTAKKINLPKQTARRHTFQLAKWMLRKLKWFIGCGHTKNRSTEMNPNLTKRKFMRGVKCESVRSINGFHSFRALRRNLSNSLMEKSSISFAAEIILKEIWFGFRSRSRHRSHLRRLMWSARSIFSYAVSIFHVRHCIVEKKW